MNIERPSQLEMGWLEERFDPSAGPRGRAVAQSAAEDRRVRDYLFIVLHFPVFDRAANRLNAGELDIFVGRDYLVTIPNQTLQPVEYLFERCRSKEELREQHFSKGSGYLLYRIVNDSFDYCFPMLRKIGNKLDAVEDEIFEGRSEEVVRDISPDQRQREEDAEAERFVEQQAAAQHAEHRRQEGEARKPGGRIAAHQPEPQHIGDRDDEDRLEARAATGSGETSRNTGPANSSSGSAITADTESW